MVDFCEYLPLITTVRLLDIRHSHIDPRCAFVLACALDRHPSLETVLLNGNPLGDFGIRALLKIYLREDPAGEEATLRLLSIEPCLSESLHAHDVPPLCLVDPSGSYVLDLRDAWARAVLIFGLRQWKELKGSRSFEKVFRFFEINGRHTVIDVKMEPLFQCIPEDGIASFTLILPQSETVTHEDPPNHRHRKLLSGHLEVRAMEFAAMCHDATLVAVVEALAADYHVRGPFIRTMCLWLGCDQGAGAALLDGASITEEDVDLLSLLPQPPQVDKSYLDMFVPTNPTGRYILTLSIPAERLVAERLFVVSAWEVELARVTGASDVSQAGNMQCLRNEAFESVPFTYLPDWRLPAFGTLEFDFVVPRRPSSKVEVLSEEQFALLLGAMKQNVAPLVMRILALRRVSQRLYVSCEQVAKLVSSMRGLSSRGEPRLEERKSRGRRRHVQPAHPMEIVLLSVLFFRIKDYTNAGRVLFLEGPFKSGARWHACERALGRLNVVDPLNIHGTDFRLRLDLHEDRQLCRLILSIAAGENQQFTPALFRGSAYGPTGGRLEPVTPPYWWATWAPPLHGTLALTYVSTEGDAGHRRRCAVRYCGWE